MKVLLQRSLEASVTVGGEVIGAIDHGLVLLVGIQRHDTEQHVENMTKKVLAYRVFGDEDDKMNLNIQDVSGALLVISQFTLAANTQKGLRPSFSSAAAPDQARDLFDLFVSKLRNKYDKVSTGEFAANMKVALINDGPVTFMLEN